MNFIESLLFKRSITETIKAIAQECLTVEEVSFISLMIGEKKEVITDIFLADSNIATGEKAYLCSNPDEYVEEKNRVLKKCSDLYDSKLIAYLEKE